MLSTAGSAPAAAGNNRTPITSDRNPNDAQARLRRELNDILYLGALTSRLKRYAAEPAPDRANLTPMCERTTNGTDNQRTPRGRPGDAYVCRNGKANCPAISAGIAGSSLP